MIDMRQDRDLRSRSIGGEQSPQGVRIDRLVVRANEDEGLVIERTQVLRISVARVIRGVEAVGIRQCFRSVPELRRLVELDDRETVERVYP